MRSWIYGVLVLPLLVGACSPNSTERYEEEGVMPEAQKVFVAYVNHGLEQAHQSLAELEEEANEATAKADTSVSNTVSHLRNELEKLSEDADTLVGAEDAKYDEEKLALRERLVDLTRTVERTRLEMFQDPEEFKQEAELRLSELDKRLYQLRSNTEKAELTEEFDSTLAALDQLREEASQRLIDLENAKPDEYRQRRGKVTTALTTLTVKLTEAESEYQTAAGTDMEYRNEEGNLDSLSDEAGRVEPINKQ